MARSEVLTELRRDLNWLRHQYEERYGCAVWDVRCRRPPPGSEFFISGYVLLPSQKRAVERVVEKRLGGEVRYHLDIETIANPGSARADSQGTPKSDFLNVYSRPPGLEPTGAHGVEPLSTQVTTTDLPFRVLFECRGWLLVQLDDCTLGWAQKNLIEVGGSCVNALESTTGANGKPAGSCYDPAEIVERASEALGVPYLLGGVTGLGIDCSGLAQKVYRDVAAVVLPRHSRDQISAGRGVAFDRRRLGDLIFLGRNGGRGLHVGLLCSREEMIHASQRRGAVVLEPLSALPASLDVIGVRRIVDACGLRAAGDSRSRPKAE